jgi:hypothetical protein
MAAKVGSTPLADQAERSLIPWQAEEFWRALKRFPRPFRGEQEFLGRGAFTIVSGEHWADLAEWHVQLQTIGGVVENARGRAWIRKAALACFEKGKFGSGMRLLSIASRHTGNGLFDSVSVTDQHAAAGVDQLSSVGIAAEMTALVQRVPFSESPSEFLAELGHARFGESPPHGLLELFSAVASAAIERCVGLSVIDQSRVFRGLVHPRASADGAALNESLQKLRQRLQASFRAKSRSAIEALRLELHLMSHDLPEPESAYRQEVTNVLCQHHEWRAELAHIFNSCHELSKQNFSNVDARTNILCWTSLLTQISNWQREDGVSRWLRAPEYLPTNGLLDLTRVADDTEDTVEWGAPTDFVCLPHEESSSYPTWEPGVGLLLFLTLIAAPAEPSTKHGWRSVPSHGGEAVLANPACELFDEFLRTVGVGSVDWNTIVFHHGLPVSYRIEALQRAQDHPWTCRPSLTTTAKTKLRPEQAKPVLWEPRESYSEVLLRDLIHSGLYEEARRRSEPARILWCPASHPPFKLFAELAACDGPEHALGWLRWYEQHWRGWLERVTRQLPRLGSFIDPSALAAGSPHSLDWSNAAHGLAFVGFELRRRLVASRLLEGLDCVLRAEFAFRLAWLGDARVSWWSLRSGPVAEPASWTLSKGENPHRVTRLAIEGLLRDQSPGSVDWACAIGVGLSFARWHRDDSYCGNLLELLASRQSELDVLERQRAEARGDSAPILTLQAIDYWKSETI